MDDHTGIAVLESRWWKESNTSVRGLFDLIADNALGNSNAYHYEGAAQLVEIVERVAEAIAAPAPAAGGPAEPAPVRGPALFAGCSDDELLGYGVPPDWLETVRQVDEDGLFFAGDLGQRIFQQPYSWLSQGVDVRGRSSLLKVNYRTSHQIRRRADRLLPPHLRDVDGVEAPRQGTISVFDGPEPVVRLFATAAEEIAFVGDWIARPQDRVAEVPGQVVIGTMHLAKGLEFKAAAVLACDDEVIPLQERIESASEESELDEIFDTERHLLYVACTWARDHVAITGVAPGSEFVADLIDAT